MEEDMKTQMLLKNFVLALTVALPLGLFAQAEQTAIDNTSNVNDLTALQEDVIAVDGQSNNVFIANWTPGANWVPGRSTGYNDSHPIAYIWQMSSHENFDTILISQEVANSFQFQSTSRVMDQVLQNYGVKVNDTVQMYHRVLASDGTWSNTGQAISLKVTRTGGQVLVSPINTATLAPVPAHDVTYLNIDASQPFIGVVSIRDMSGREMHSEILNVSQVGQTRVPINVDMMERGIYFVSVIQDDQNVALLKFIKQ